MILHLYEYSHVDKLSTHNEGLITFLIFIKHLTSVNSLIHGKDCIKSKYPSIFLTFIGFSCDDGELYTLIGSDKLISELSNNQGYHLEIKGYVEKPNETDRQMNKLKNGYLVVEKWKKIDE